MYQRDIKVYGKSHARRAAIKLLYQWDMSQSKMEDETTPSDNENSFSNLTSSNQKYAKMLYDGVIRELEAIDAEITLYIKRGAARIGGMERAILRTGTFELMYMQDLPARVAINEAIEISKIFCGEGGYRFVNAVLDKVSKNVRKSQ